MNFVDEMIIDKDEGCGDLEPLEMSVDTAELSDHVSTTPPLSPPPLKSDVEVKTAKKKLVIEPTPIRLNKVLCRQLLDWIFICLVFRDWDPLTVQEKTELFLTLDHQVLCQVLWSDNKLLL